MDESMSESAKEKILLLARKAYWKARTPTEEALIIALMVVLGDDSPYCRENAD